MRAANNTNEAQKTLTYENLRLVSQRSEIQHIFFGQHCIQAQRMRSDLERVARRPFNILITGETGTGKTQMARQIHRMSVRSNKPFVELNCANLPEHLVEAELFGHRKGALTGADYDRKGLFKKLRAAFFFLTRLVISR
jgi:transcriptional regulator with GAF, ATPase, and Fis domain